MAFSIKQVKAILSSHNIPVDELDGCAEELCSRHNADLDSIKEERDSFRKDSETLVSVRAELDKLKQAEDGTLKDKYDKLKKDFDDYKEEVQNKETLAEKKAVLTQLAKDAGLSAAGIAKAIKYADWDSIELDENGEAKDAKAIIKSLKEEWPEHIQTTTTTGANTSTPPGSNTSSKVLKKEEILKIQDTSERQKAWGDYIKAQNELKGE